MDEADLLGDRVAIIASGELVCCGSSVFLKNQLGKGYYLTIDSTTRSQMTGRALTMRVEKDTGSAQARGRLEFVLAKKCNVRNDINLFCLSELKQFLSTIMPNIELVEEIGSEIVFMLPVQNDPSAFDKLFKALEDNKKRLNIDSYGVSDTTLEEVSKVLRFLF